MTLSIKSYQSAVIQQEIKNDIQENDNFDDFIDDGSKVKYLAYFR